MFGDDADDEPEPDGRQFDAVTRFDEAEEPDVGPAVPETPSPEDVDPRVRSLFWTLAVVFNLAVLGIGIGLVLVVFGGDVVLGGQLVVAGVLLFGYGVYRLPRAKAEVSRIVDDEEKG